MENEFSGYSIEELEVKKRRFLKLQKVILVIAVIFAATVLALAISRQASQLYSLSGLLLVLGIGYPMMAFGPIRKKIQEEIDSRS